MLCVHTHMLTPTHHQPPETHNHTNTNHTQIVDLLQGQHQSSLRCPAPACGHASRVYEPYMFLQLPIPLLATVSNYSVFACVYVCVCACVWLCVCIYVYMYLWMDGYTLP